MTTRLSAAIQRAKEHGELPEHLRSYWQGRIDDRMYPNYCAKRRT